jgi:predicted MFS family arabinose efflux permease
VMLSWLGAGAITGAFLMGRAGQQLTMNQRVLLGSIGFVGTNLALALVPNEYWLFPVMFISGTCWLIVMTSFNTTVQLHVPKWVQARVVSIYMLTFQAGMSLGSVAWGELADRISLQTALLGAAGWMLASLLLALPFPIHHRPHYCYAHGRNHRPRRWPRSRDDSLRGSARRLACLP